MTGMGARLLCQTEANDRFRDFNAQLRTTEMGSEVADHSCRFAVPFPVGAHRHSACTQPINIGSRQQLADVKTCIIFGQPRTRYFWVNLNKAE